MRAIVGGKVELILEDCECGWISAAGWVDIFDEYGAGNGAIALPQLAAMHAIIGDEVE